MLAILASWLTLFPTRENSCESRERSCKNIGSIVRCRLITICAVNTASRTKSDWCFTGVAHQLLGAVQFGRRDAGAQPLAAEAGIVFAWPAARAAFFGLPGHQRSLWVTQGTQWADERSYGVLGGVPLTRVFVPQKHCSLSVL